MIMIYDEDDTDIDDDGDDYDKTFITSYMSQYLCVQNILKFYCSKWYICHSYAGHNDGIILILLLPQQMTLTYYY